MKFVLYLALSFFITGCSNIKINKYVDNDFTKSSILQTVKKSNCGSIYLDGSEGMYEEEEFLKLLKDFDCHNIW